MKKLILTSSIILIASCSTKTIPVQVPLLCPDPLEFEGFPAELVSQAQMMSRELRTYFIKRDKLQTARRETLQAICRSTHNTNE